MVFVLTPTKPVLNQEYFDQVIRYYNAEICYDAVWWASWFTGPSTQNPVELLIDEALADAEATPAQQERSGHYVESELDDADLSDEKPVRPFRSILHLRHFIK